MQRRIFIIGAGGHARVLAETAEAAGFVVIGFVEEPRFTGELVAGKPLRFTSLYTLKSDGGHDGGALFVSDSRNDSRLHLIGEAKGLGFTLPPLVHPSAIISPSASIGEATCILPGAIVHTGAFIGRGCILNTACSVDHDSVVDDAAQICPGVHAGGGVTFGSQCFVGTGASIKPGIRIGERAVIGAGAVVIRDVPPGVTVVGNPARPIYRSAANIDVPTASSN